ncbi:hypothetical protein V5799_017230 [Amblyomma americanum]|uniref:8.9 kDa family member n=1 Tax=Amblyomma americanum TaxID=6943 RepID=A0AAQ4F309_AMBAM
MLWFYTVPTEPVCDPRRMAAILQTVLFFVTLEFAHVTTGLELVSFLGQTCQYDRYAFNTRYNMPENCTWLSCDAKNQRVTINQCAVRARVGSGHSSRDFPKCCWPGSDRDGQYFEHKSRTHYAGDLKVITETFKRVYHGNLSGTELCTRSHKHFCPEKHVAPSCCGVTYNEKENTTEVQWCPFLDNSNGPEGALVSSGKPHAQYPNCCPEYLHGPAKYNCYLDSNK